MTVISKLTYEDELWLNMNMMHRAHKYMFSPWVWFTSPPNSLICGVFRRGLSFLCRTSLISHVEILDSHQVRSGLWGSGRHELRSWVPNAHSHIKLPMIQCPLDSCLLNSKNGEFIRKFYCIFTGKSQAEGRQNFYLAEMGPPNGTPMNR